MTNLAIINTQQPDQKDSEPRRGIIPGPGPGPEDPLMPPTGGDAKSSSSPWIWSLLAVGIVAVGVVAAFTFDLFTSEEGASPSTLSPSVGHTVPANAERLKLQVDKLVRIAGLAAIVEKKIDQNRNALDTAKQSQDQVMMDTFRLALAQNLKDLQEYRAAQVAQLAELYVHYQSSPDLVEKHFKERLKSSEDAFKIGNSKVIQNALALMKSVPEGSDARPFFKKRIYGE